MRGAAITIALVFAPLLLAQQALHEDSVPAQSVLKPRVLLRAVPNRSGGWSSLGSSAMGMSKDFQEACPGVRVSINLYVADYTVELNRILHSFVPENQMMVANKDGDLISRVSEWGGLKGAVKKACTAILEDWAKK